MRGAADPSITIRTARADEADALTQLCLRSKAHWGYDAAFMAQAAPSLVVHVETIGRVRVAVDDADRPLGVVRLDPVEANEADLGLLFVDPAAMGRGVGRALVERAISEARASGCRRLTILADPQAAPFYERLGARYLREAPSDAIPGRTLPFFEIAL